MKESQRAAATISISKPKKRHTRQRKRCKLTELIKLPLNTPAATDADTLFPMMLNTPSVADDTSGTDAE